MAKEAPAVKLVDLQKYNGILRRDLRCEGIRTVASGSAACKLPACALLALSNSTSEQVATAALFFRLVAKEWIYFWLRLATEIGFVWLRCLATAEIMATIFGHAHVLVLATFGYVWLRYFYASALKVASSQKCVFFGYSLVLDERCWKNIAKSDGIAKKIGYDL